MVGKQGAEKEGGCQISFSPQFPNSAFRKQIPSIGEDNWRERGWIRFPNRKGRLLFVTILWDGLLRTGVRREPRGRDRCWQSCFLTKGRGQFSEGCPRSGVGVVLTPPAPEVDAGPERRCWPEQEPTVLGLEQGRSGEGRRQRKESAARYGFKRMIWQRTSIPSSLSSWVLRSKLRRWELTMDVTMAAFPFRARTPRAMLFWALANPLCRIRVSKPMVVNAFVGVPFFQILIP